MRTKHGKYKSKEYLAWQNMLARCNNASRPRYKDYGGRGITVCDEWLKFENFYRDMGDMPVGRGSLDRIDNNGNYCKENCRWASQKEQGNNRRSNRIIEFNGETKTATQWADCLGISLSSLTSRLSKMSVAEALTLGKRPPIRVDFNGRCHTLREWSDQTGISCSTLYRRTLVLGWPVERALTEKVK